MDNNTIPIEDPSKLPYEPFTLEEAEKVADMTSPEFPLWYKAYKKRGGKKNVQEFHAILIRFYYRTWDAYIPGLIQKHLVWGTWVEECNGDYREAQRIFRAVDSVTAYT